MSIVIIRRHQIANPPFQGRVKTLKKKKKRDRRKPYGTNFTKQKISDNNNSRSLSYNVSIYLTEILFSNSNFYFNYKKLYK